MINALRNTYSLDDSQVSYLNSMLDPQGQKAIAVATGRFVTKYGSVAAIKALLVRYAGKVAAKSMVKWVPFVGSVVSAGLSYKLTYHLGDSAIDDCEEGAFAMLDAIVDAEKRQLG